MSLWSRLANVFRGERLIRDLDDEIASHLEEAIDEGRDPAEARRAFGSTLRLREESRDLKLVVWLDGIRADVVFGWRQLRKNVVTSAAAILSLALAIGACTAAFRLIDALLLRPLPVAEPDRLFSLFNESADIDGRVRVIEAYPHPLFRAMRDTVRDQAELVAVSLVQPADVTYGSDEDMEKANVHYVSGWMFGTFGLRPAAGRLLTEDDDRTPGAHPYAVLSHEYWTRRFGGRPEAIGRTFRMGPTLYTIVGVCEERFTGTEPGVAAGIFVPAMMNPAAIRPGASWVRIFVQLKAGVAADSVRDKLRVPFRSAREEQAKSMRGVPAQRIALFLNEQLAIAPASAGASRLQRDYARALVALGVLVALVLLIACANVANLMTAQGAARAREMALRVSIGAGRWRLVQLALVESCWLGVLASAAGVLFAWWAAPFVVGRISTPDVPVRLSLPFDWRLLGFALALTLAVIVSFGLVPALHASAVAPMHALKGGERLVSRRRLMGVLVAVQVAFCFLVHLAAALFVASLYQLTNRPTGFSADRILLVDAVAARPQPAPVWRQATDHLRATAGVDTAAVAGWPLLGRQAMVLAMAFNGTVHPDVSYYMGVSPGWLAAMKIPLVAGRDFRDGDTHPGSAIVNEAFVSHYLPPGNPLGMTFQNADRSSSFQIVGVAGNARYRDLREPLAPVVYVPFDSVNANGVAMPQRAGTFVVRTSSPTPLALAPVLREEVRRARPELRVSNVRTQAALNDSYTLRERLLAILGLFFAAVALVLAGLGLYGMLYYSVVQRRRELGIRVALGAGLTNMTAEVTAHVFGMVLAGAIAGVALGLTLTRYVEGLFYQVAATDITMLATPSAVIVAVALLAAIPAVLRAIRIDPAITLRTD